MSDAINRKDLEDFGTRISAELKLVIAENGKDLYKTLSKIVLDVNENRINIENEKPRVDLILKQLESMVKCMPNYIEKTNALETDVAKIKVELAEVLGQRKSIYYALAFIGSLSTIGIGLIALYRK